MTAENSSPAGVKTSMMVPFAPPRSHQMLPYAALAQWSGSHTLWQGQAAVGDPFQSFAYAAASGFPVSAGTGVTLMPQRNPLEAAMQAQTLAANLGHPVVAGYGPGAKVFQKAALGAPYRSQLGACREYATIVRSLLAGEQVEFEGEFFSCHSDLPQIPRPAVEVGLGVLRPGMARLAGEVADVAITWLTPARYLREVVVPALREGAAAAGRPVPRLVAMVPVALAEDERVPTDLALASNRAHMSLPHYVDMLRRSEIEVDIDADPVASAQALIDGGAFLYGSISEVNERFAEFRDAGVDEVVFNITGVHLTHGMRAGLKELETLLREVTP